MKAARGFGQIANVGTIAAMGVLVTIGNLTPYALPVIVGAQVDYLHLQTQIAGYLGTVELTGLGLGAALFSTLILRVNWQLFALVANVLLIVATLATPFSPDVPALFVIRFVSGLGGGMLLSMSAAGLSSTATPERTLGSVQIFGMIFSGCVLYALPLILLHFGVIVMFTVIAALYVVAMPLLLLLPKRSPFVEDMERDSIDWRAEAKQHGAVGIPHLGSAASALVGIFFFFTAAMGFWVFYERVGVGMGLPTEQIAQVLGISQLFGAAGALSAVVVATRLGTRAVPMGFSILLAMGCSIAMTQPLDPNLYRIAAFGFCFSWGFVYPYMMGVCISLDPSARVVGYALALQTIGKAIGPGLAATLIVGTSFTNIYWLTLSMFTVSLLIFLPSIFATDRLLRLQNRAQAKKGNVLAADLG